MITTRKTLRGLLATMLGLGTVALGSVHASAAASSNTLTVTATEYKFGMKGHLRPGWADIKFVNHGGETHMMQVARLKPGVTTSQLEQALESDDEDTANALLAGSPDETYGTPDLIDPHRKTEVITKQLVAGHYALLCFVPSAKGTPHAAMGMVRTFDVSGQPAKGHAPRRSATVDLTDFHISGVPKHLDGHVMLKVANTGQSAHSFTVARLEPGKTIQDAMQYLSAKFDTQNAHGKAPAFLVGGVSELQSGQSAYLRLDLRPGRYGYASTSGDNDQGGSDASKGMVGLFTVR